MIRSTEDGNSLDAIAFCNSQAALVKRSKMKSKDENTLEF